MVWSRILKKMRKRGCKTRFQKATEELRNLCSRCPRNTSFVNAPLLFIRKGIVRKEFYQNGNIHLSKFSAEILANEIQKIITVIPKRKFDLNPCDTDEDLFFWSRPSLAWAKKVFIIFLLLVKNGILKSNFNCIIKPYWYSFSEKMWRHQNQGVMDL